MCHFISPKINIVVLQHRDIAFKNLISINYRTIFHNPIVPTSYEVGISPDELNVHLWKGNHVSHNTFSVALTRMRNLLSSIPSLKIVTHDGILSIECENIGDCDFILYKHLTQYFKSEKVYHKEIIHEFCKLTSSGELLPGYTNWWIDPIKSNISLEVVNTLLDIAVNYDFNDDYQLQVIVGETILKWDKLEQKGLELAVSGLKKLGKYGRIKESFSSFSERYKDTFDTEFPHTIKSLTQP